MAGSIDALAATRAVIVVGGLAYAAAADLKTREISDRLWQLLGTLGVVLGALVVAPGGLLGLLTWVAVGVLALEHLFPWDDAFGERRLGLVLGLELAAYAVVLAVVAGSAVRWGVGPSAVPVVVVAALASVLLARGLFELGVLYGGADAKALIVVGVVLPVVAVPYLYAPSSPALILGVLPFAVTVLTNAALLSVAVPLAIAARNVARGEFGGLRGFTSYTLAVDDLPSRFVWVRDPALGEDSMAEDSETSEDDARRRGEIAARLRARGVSRVWVTPQLPFVVLLAAAALVGLAAGNLLLDLFAAL